MTAQPKPTAAWLLAEHAKCRWNGFQRPAARMTCGAPMPSAGPDFTAQHQADMLAAAGYPTTPEALAEHDAQVAAEALRRKARIYRRAGVWLAAADDLDSDAARIAAGEEP